MEYQITGSTLTGADIGGFIGDTTPELNARWHKVGSFYPFSRNHADILSVNQEPYRYADQYYEG